MEIGINSLNSSIQTPVFPFSIKLGDQIVAQVVQRLMPFRYLVRFQNQLFPVSSSLYLKKGDLILIELKETQPRLKFQFLTHLNGSEKADNISFLLKLFGWEDTPFNRLFVNWAIQLNLPIKSGDYRRLKRLYNNHPHLQHHPENILLPYFWGKAELRESDYSDPLFLLSWVFDPGFWNGLENESEAGAESRDQAKWLEELTNPLVWFRILQSLFSSERPFHTLFQFWFRTTDQGGDRIFNSEKALAISLASKSDPGMFSLDLLKFLYSQIKLLNEYRWACLPIFQEHSHQNFFTFWRKVKGKDIRQFKFYFNWMSNHFGGIGVKGEVRGKNIRLQFVSDNQDFWSFVDKKHIELHTCIKRLKMHLIDYEIKSTREVTNQFRMIFDDIRRSKFEMVL
ncbi:MAG: hypothetical protein Kow0042_03430 [Calditrichia bacterium]